MTFTNNISQMDVCAKVKEEVNAAILGISGRRRYNLR